MGRGSEQCACVVDASWLAGLSEVCCCLAAFSKSASVVCSEQISLKWGIGNGGGMGRSPKGKGSVQKGVVTTWPKERTSQPSMWKVTCRWCCCSKRLLLQRKPLPPPPAGRLLAFLDSAECVCV